MRQESEADTNPWWVCDVAAMHKLRSRDARQQEMLERTCISVAASAMKVDIAGKIRNLASSMRIYQKQIANAIQGIGCKSDEDANNVIDSSRRFYEYSGQEIKRLERMQEAGFEYDTVGAEQTLNVVDVDTKPGRIIAPVSGFKGLLRRIAKRRIVRPSKV